MRSLRRTSALLLFVATSQAYGQATGSLPPTVGRAAKWVESRPDVARQIAFAEIQRSHGFKQAGIEHLEKIAKNLAASDPRAAELQELLCWRLLPVATAQRENFRQQVARLKAIQAANAWVPVWELYLLAGEPNRAALLSAMAKAPAVAPDRFPSLSAEKAHVELLMELGQPRLRAGVEVISSRGHEPLHALRDLDRFLSREADFLRGSDRVEDAKQILAVRDLYRQAYRQASRHLVEKLFALHLAGETKERDTLLAKAKALPYLHDRQRLAPLLDGMEEEQAWKLLIEPLLNSELALIDHPPNLTQLAPRSVAELRIQARKKTVQDKTVHYEGDVRFRLHDLELSCNQLTVLHHDDPTAVLLSGSEKVQLRGFIPYPNGVSADRFTYNAEAGSFSLGGDVRLRAHDKTTKLRAATLSRQGEVRDPRSLLDDFKNAFTIDAKLDLLPKITKVYDDAELPDEVRYLLALNTLRPHLTWHAPYLPPFSTRTQQADRVKEQLAHERYNDTPWQHALGGEAWMLAEISPTIEADYRESLRSWYKKWTSRHHDTRGIPPNVPIPEKSLYFWRLRDPQHADVARAIRLLQRIQAEGLGDKARRWVAELRRNNTVLTFDIAGAAPMGNAHSLLMDVRNAERVTFKLYRVQKPEELLFAAKEIGKDFLYRDHHLDDRSGGRMMDDIAQKLQRDIGRRGKRADARELQPAWTKEQLVHQWNVRVAELEHHAADRVRRYSRRWHDDPWYDEADSHYFDDECSEHRERIDKSYRTQAEDYAISSWQCDRVVQIPEKLLADAGAYVLVAEANGQTAHVPLVVEPLSLTLRRCRDGVFALVSDAEGKKPLEGATVLGLPSRFNREERAAVTDKEGVAFARVLGFGDRPIVVHHEGRYAIGGFGQLFEAIYDEPSYERDYMLRDRLLRARRGDAKESSASVYADRHVVVAYTDRPTYRPGQEVQFKLIVRKLQPEKSGDPEVTFRGAEFDAKTKMVLPDLNDAVAYAVLDPKGREVARGSLTLSEFGTAAGKLALNTESVVGSYTFRVYVGGEPRIVPEVFAVKHYRRPHFEVNVAGVPATLARPEKLTLSVSGRYYFGPPVLNGTVEVRVLRKNLRKSIAEEHATLDENGQAKVELRLPRTLEAGSYLVVSSITDESGRTVSTTTPMKFESPGAPKGVSELDALPRFLAVNQELKAASSAKEIRVQHDLTDRPIPVKNGFATLKFSEPGWYTLRAGDDESRLFVYGGHEHPLSFGEPREDRDTGGTHIHQTKWINLSDYAWQEEQRISRWEKFDQHLFAIFDQQSLKVGDKLRMLVYVPHQISKLLFTIEGRTILDYAIVEAKEGAGAYQVVEIPMKERYFPNVYVQGRILAQATTKLVDARKELAKHADRYLDDHDDHDPRWCRVDVARPGKVEGAALNVQIETDQASYRPGDTVRASIKVTDRDGRPQAAELSLAAVDDSVFSFGEDQLDSLPSFFRMPYETRRFQPKVWRVSFGSRWSKKTLDSTKGRKQIIRHLDQVMKQMAEMSKASESKMGESVPDLRDQHLTLVPLPQLGGEMPAGQIPLARLREHFHETATWLPQLRTDESGIARAAFTLPDSLTRYRLTSLALTKTTEVGLGRARIAAGLPLAVQVFVPRFAVEKDRMQAVALVHNSTNQERECEYAWKIDGAGAEPAALAGKVKVPAKSSAKVGLWLKLDQIGTARIAFRASEGKESDGEVRTLPVHPLGRPAEINANENLAVAPLKKAAVKEIVGKFEKEGRVQLPAGFVARELHISLTVSDLAQALDGLDYLVDYPNGCIEQTMSRFFPVVMIKHATQNSPITLQPEIAAKLPDILTKGLTRVYGHQHADGSWGWFAKDKRNLPMSVYVVYGLARCQAAGTKVDAQVLRNGCDYLREELRTNKHEPELAARAWYALALAGQADTKELEKWARQASQSMEYRAEAWCNLALACRTAGLNELGEQLWSKARTWSGHDTETIALVLKTQLAFGAPYRESRDSATRLLAKRNGTRWYHTRDTAWAIEALSSMFAYVPEKAIVRKIEVTLAGKTILEVKDAAELKKLVYRVRLSAEQLPVHEALEIRMKADSDEPIQVAVRAVGVQRLDDIKASGTRVKIERRLETLDGEPVRGALKIGQIVRVRLRLDLQQTENHLMIEERRPSLCEFADDSISGASARHAVHQEFRDDRLCIFFTSMPAGAHEIVYYLRAETPGQCSVLPGSAYPMYDEKARGETASSKLEVKGP